MLDVGCGSLRGGRHFIEYLNEYNYYGTDLNPSLIEAGRTKELTREQNRKVRDSNFIASDNFDINFDCSDFDYGLALSVFTHLPKNRVRAVIPHLIN